MTDETPPRGWPAAPPFDSRDESLQNGRASAGTEPGLPQPSRRREGTDAVERERAGSIAPMSSPIVSLGDDEGARSERAPASRSEPPSPSVRRLVPPPKPKNYESRPPPGPEPAPVKRPQFPAPEFPASPSAPVAPVRVPSLAPDLAALRAAASQRPGPSVRPTPSTSKGDREDSLGSLQSKLPAQVPPPPPLPQSFAFPSPRASSKPPATLPSSSLSSRIPVTAQSGDESSAQRELVAAARPPAVPRRSGDETSEPRVAAPAMPHPSTASRGIDSLADDAPPMNRLAREPVHAGPAAQHAEPGLPPARRMKTWPSDEPPPSGSGGRAAVLPKATREPLRRSTTPPPKPRIVPQRPVKETPTVAIQAMRIIAIGTEESLGIANGLAAEGDSSAPTHEEPGWSLSSPPSSGPEIEAFETTSAELELPDIPPLADNALQDMPPLPEAALMEMPELPEAAWADPSEADTPTPEPLGLELYPLQSSEPVPPSDGTGSFELAGQPSLAGAEQFVAETLGGDFDEGPDSEPAPESVEPVDLDSPTSARRRPPPPRRISVPSAPPTDPPIVEPAAAVGSPVAMQAAPSPALESAPRQPPPAPSRAPRVPERSKDPAAPPVAVAAPATNSVPAEKPKTRPRRLWWEELFGEDFSRATARLSDIQIDQEASFIEESLGVAPGGALLDLGCGAGYHAVELASRGYGIVGYDLSLHQLALAQDVAQERDQKLNFLQGDMREMAFEEVFDGMYCWNTTFGYFEEEKNVLVAQRMFAALKPGGTLLLDVANRDFVAMDQPSSVWYEGDSCVCMDDMSVDFFTSRLRVKRSLILDDGRTRECHYSIRLYSLHELGKMLHDIGFRVTEASGHPATPGVFLGQSSPRIIILAQKP